MKRIPRTYARNRRSERKKPIYYVLGLLLGALLLYGAGSYVMGFFSFEHRQIESTLFTTSTPNLVQIQLEGESWNTGITDVKLYEKNRVKTAESTAELQMFDGSIVTLDVNTEVQIISAFSSETSGNWSIALLSGRLVVKASEDLLTKRSIMHPQANITLPKNSISSISDVEIANIQDASAGISIAPLNSKETFTIGEGQIYQIPNTGFLLTTEENYAIRTALSAQYLEDKFIQTYAKGKAILTTDNPSEFLIVSNPKDNTTIKTKTLTVTGVINESVDSVEVGTVPATIESGEFTAEVELSDGKNEISIQALDKDKKVLTETLLQITYEVPVIERPRIISPQFKNGVYTTVDESVVINGETNADTQAIIVNDYTLQLYTPGEVSWRYIAQTALGNLKVGSNEFTIVAKNTSGVLSEPVKVTVVLDPTNSSASSSNSSSTSSTSTSQSTVSSSNTSVVSTAEVSLTVTGPSQNGTYSTSEPEILLEGKNSANIAKMVVNGYTLQLFEPAKGFWNYKASSNLGTMKSGKNTYTIEAKNAAGVTVATKTFTIEYTPQE